MGLVVIVTVGVCVLGLCLCGCSGFCVSLCSLFEFVGVCVCVWCSVLLFLFVCVF